MKLFMLCIATLLLQPGSVDLREVRVAYKEAAHDKTRVEAFYLLLSDVTKDNDPALVAYKGAAIALKARSAKTIKKKKEGFVKGVSYIEHAIKENPDAIEPRFVRLGIQENSPKVLKYKDNIEEDKRFILEHFENIDPEDLKNHLKNYISQSSLFSDEEKTVISRQ